MAANTATFNQAMLSNNPVWAQLLGLCPLMAVSNSVVNALGLSIASAFVLIGSNGVISIVRGHIATHLRLPSFVLVIASFTTCAVMLLEAFAFELYLSIALFVQIIVTNCMILGRIEAFASRNSLGSTLMDASGCAAGFTLALLTLGAVREVLGHGTLFANMDLLFTDAAAGWVVRLLPEDYSVLIALLPPGAFLTAGLLLALGNRLRSPGASE